MRSASFIFLTFIITAFTSCKKVIPTGFWKNYKEGLLVENLSDHGPYGGHTAIHWKSEIPFSFDTNELIDFASKNGWSLIDSLTFEHAQTIKWIYSHKKIFPLSHTGFNTVKNISTYDYFPRWFDGPLKLYKFKTGWITVEPGTDNTIEENGFVILNQNKKRTSSLPFVG